jgi:tellurite resistance protein
MTRSTPQAASTNLLGLFAVPLGLAGVGGVWQTAHASLSAPAWPAELLFGISVALWAALTATYFVGGLRRPGTFTADRTHAIYGPFAAYIPIIGIMLAAHYEHYTRVAGRTAVAVFVVALIVIVAQLLAHWLLGNLPIATFHPGYFLPTVAGAFIASIGLSASGWHQVAQGAFGVGVFFWLSIGTLIFHRLFTGAPLPDAIKPSLSVLLSPPAVAGIAWLILTNAQIDTVAATLLGILLMMVLVQVLFFSEYRHLSFTMNFWAFTFPVAASANFVMLWIHAEQFPFWRAWSWTLVGVTTAFALALTAASVADRTRSRHTASAPGTAPYQSRPAAAMREPGVQAVPDQQEQAKQHPVVLDGRLRPPDEGSPAPPEDR